MKGVLYVGTQKGLFRARRRNGRWFLDGPHIEGYEVLHSCASPARPGQVLAAVSHAVWGAHVYRSVDGGERWEPLAAAPHHAAGRFETGLKAVWGLAWTPDGRRLYAGIDPAGLFFSDDEGASWEPVEGLNEHPTRDLWEPAKGGFSVHSIVIDPGRPQRMAVAVSAGGAFVSEDGGERWRAANAGVRAENRPDPHPEAGHNIHRLVMAPGASGRLYRQCYNGTWRSDDWGANWTEITAGLPSDFGYGLATDPREPDVVYQVPIESSHLRTVVGGRLRVYRSRDGGRSWESASEGLPDVHVYVSVLREALEAGGEPCGVYLGTSGGHLFAHPEPDGPWELVAGFLPRILSVKCHGTA